MAFVMKMDGSLHRTQLCFEFLWIRGAPNAAGLEELQVLLFSMCPLEGRLRLSISLLDDGEGAVSLALSLISV